MKLFDTIVFRTRAIRARRYYYNHRGYLPNQLPCYSCIWEKGDDYLGWETDDNPPWHWIYCNECDWGNR